MIQLENEGNNDNEEELQQDTKEPIIDNTQKNNEINEHDEIKENIDQHNEEEENNNNNNKQLDNNEEVINEQKEENIENDNNNDLHNANNVNDNKTEIEQEKQNDNTIPINEEEQQQLPQTEHEIEHNEQQQINNQLNEDNNSSPNQHVNTCTLTDQAVQTIPIVNPLFKSSSKLQITSQYRIKPKFYKLLNQVITTSFDPILNYLDLYDLCNLRIINKMYLALIHDYYQRRLKLEISFITQYQEENKEKTAMFMKSIDSQIPISNNNWLDFNLSSVTSKLQLLDRNILTKLRSIKSTGKLSDSIYAPFCIIFGFNKDNNPLTKKDTWKKTAGKILSNSNLLLKIADLDLENMPDDEMLKAFVYLNLPELDIDIVKRSSSDFAKLILWCQGVVSYHILIHPYIYRNESGDIGYGSDVYEYAYKMNEMIDKFYKFKRFLYNLNIVKIPLADYVFNLQHTRELPHKEETMIKGINDSLIGNILSYLTYNQSWKLMSVCKKFYNGFKCSIDFMILDILKEIFHVKLHSYNKIGNSVSIMYSHNLFSSYFLMIDSLLNPSSGLYKGNSPLFFNKEYLNDIKKIKYINNSIDSIAKVFCLLCQQKPLRKTNSKGEIVMSYLERIKSLINNNTFEKVTRNLNKLVINKNKICILNKELKQFHSSTKIDEVKRISKGMFQILLWELLMYEYLINYNPFDFISKDYIKNKYTQEEQEIVNYYSELLDYLLKHLSVKYHFNVVNGNYCSYAFDKHYRNLKQCLNKKHLLDNDIKLYFTSLSSNKDELARQYFNETNNNTNKNKADITEHIVKQIIHIYENEHNPIPLSTTDDNTNNHHHHIESIDNNSKTKNKFPSEDIKSSYTNSHNLLPQQHKQYKTYNNSTTNFHTNNGGFPKTISQSHNNTFTNTKRNDYLSIDTIDPEICLINILPYVDLSSLPKFALVSKHCCELIKTHIFLRVFMLKKEKTLLEKENEDIIKSIQSKRNEFYKEYELQPPSKEHSGLLLGQISNGDVMELKQCFRKENKSYEKVITPLMILLGEKPSRSTLQDGSKVMTYYPTAKRVLNNLNFTKRIKEFELELLTPDTFRKVEEILNEPFYKSEKIKGLGPSMCHVISWVNGVVEYHRTVRKFCLNDYDYGILDDNEIEFCIGMDNIALQYYKMVRYAFKYCGTYQKYANLIINKLGLSKEEL